MTGQERTISGMDADLAELFRIKSMIDATVQMEPNDSAASALVSAYNRLRTQAIAFVRAADDLPTTEFENLFRLLPGVSVPEQLDQFAMQSAKLESEAKNASILLRQLGGWFDGVIAARTLDQRIAAEARAKAEIEARPATGFTSPA